ncbi:hypothetical protein BH11MYX3_BH11MYX3_45700 [soil metagenome]
MRRLILLFAVLAACGDNSHPATEDGGLDAPADASSGRVTGCLDRPGVLPTAPNGELPCDLVPPGVNL